jgi:multidrug resistance efflux pump
MTDSHSAPLNIHDGVGHPQTAPNRSPAARHIRPWRIVPVLITFGTVALAVLLGWAMWDTYVTAPWTRDGTVRAYVVNQASEVSGRIVNLPVHADQYVHKGDLLLEIDPTDYRIAVDLAQAQVAAAQADVSNKRTEAYRRQRLPRDVVSTEETQRSVSDAQVADAKYRQAQAELECAQVNLQRTRVISPVNGYITNLTAQMGDYATAGHSVLNIVNSDSFWVEGYFEETQLDRIQVGDAAKISLMGYRRPLTGRVRSITRGIEVANAQSGDAGLATVNPVYTWIRLAQRVPVRISIDKVPPGVNLVAGLTATVEIDGQQGE